MIGLKVLHQAWENIIVDEPAPEHKEAWYFVKDTLADRILVELGVRPSDNLINIMEAIGPTHPAKLEDKAWTRWYILYTIGEYKAFRLGFPSLDIEMWGHFGFREVLEHWRDDYARFPKQEFKQQCLARINFYLNR